MGALENLQAKFGCQLLFVESGGDNLAANYSRELADYIIYVIDVSVSLQRSSFSLANIYSTNLRGATRYPAKEDQAYHSPTCL